MTRFQPQWLQAGSYSGSQDRRLIGALWPGPASTGFAVTPASAMILNIAAGQGAVPTANNTGAVLCTSDAVEQITLTPAPPSGSNRYDLVILRPRGNDLDGGANNDFIFDQVTGTVGGAVPATPAGTLPLASVFIPGGSASISGANIADLRPGNLAVTSAILPASAPRGWVAQALGPASAVNITGGVVVASVTAPVVAGRRYRITCFGWGQQITAVGPAAYWTLASAANIDSTQGRFVHDVNVPVASYVKGTGVYTYLATASGSQTWALQGFSNGGALAVAVNACFVAVEDIGGS